MRVVSIGVEDDWREEVRPLISEWVWGPGDGVGVEWMRWEMVAREVVDWARAAARVLAVLSRRAEACWTVCRRPGRLQDRLAEVARSWVRELVSGILWWVHSRVLVAWW